MNTEQKVDYLITTLETLFVLYASSSRFILCFIQLNQPTMLTLSVDIFFI